MRWGGEWLGLEVLVAADVVKTAALDVTLNHASRLGPLVFVRTFPSWPLAVEIERRLAVVEAHRTG